MGVFKLGAKTGGGGGGQQSKAIYCNNVSLKYYFKLNSLEQEFFIATL